jgi:hypothetical protein
MATSPFGANSTRWPKLAEFRQQLHQALAADEKYVAVVEVCGYRRAQAPGDWVGSETFVIA